jgi:hypothetical protein
MELDRGRGKTEAYRNLKESPAATARSRAGFRAAWRPGERGKGGEMVERAWGFK